MYIKGPVGALSEFAVADDVDPNLGLFLNDLCHGLCQGSLISCRRRRIVGAGAQHGEKIIGPHRLPT